MTSAAWQLGPPLVGLGDAAADAQLASDLQAAGPSLVPAQVNDAVQTYNNRYAAATGALMGILGGGPVNAETMGPVITTALAVAGITDPVILAVVAVGLPILDKIIALFSSPAPACTWMVGDACFTKTRPYGPASDTWVRFDDFVASDFEASPGGPVNGAFPFYRSTIECELRWIEQAGGGDNVFQFIKAYDLAWKINAEYAINGYGGHIDDCQLLSAVAAAWNNAHSSSSTYVFQKTPQQVLGNNQSRTDWQCMNAYGQGNLNDPSTPTYIGLLLAGVPTGTECSIPPINTGPRLLDLNNPWVLRAKAGGGGVSMKLATPGMSTAGKVATGAAIVGGAAAAGVGIWAFLTHQAYGEAWKRVWKKTGGRAFKR
jgi:hypothetical protein